MASPIYAWPPPPTQPALTRVGLGPLEALNGEKRLAPLSQAEIKIKINRKLLGTKIIMEKSTTLLILPHIDWFAALKMYLSNPFFKVIFGATLPPAATSSCSVSLMNPGLPLEIQILLAVEGSAHFTSQSG